ncbi:hypothetical protein ACFW6N_21810 [Streptomyces cyaneofuscatus]|uniref:hypothetical protein n=1 Tax=Streptomyces cyaneofuscatus TaxID=66883 RepID=UPI00367DE911
MAPADPMSSTHSDCARPAWQLYAAAHEHASIPDLLHLAEHLPDEHRDADALLDRARRDFGDERP